jgi:hypothetical protein
MGMGMEPTGGEIHPVFFDVRFPATALENNSPTLRLPLSCVGVGVQTGPFQNLRITPTLQLTPPSGGVN